MRQRLTPSAICQAATLARVYEPGLAVAAGFLDEAVEDGAIADRFRAVASDLKLLEAGAFGRAKIRVRAPAVSALEAAIETDRQDFLSLQAKQREGRHSAPYVEVAIAGSRWTGAGS